MTFKDLAELTKDGAVLTAVKDEQVEGKSKYSGDFNRFSFCLNGKTYSADEDPDDGYRSYCSSIEVSDEALPEAFLCEVKGRMADDGSYEVNDVLELVDVKTGWVVLEVGTANTDDCYPYCVQRFNPTAMAVNQGVK
jgi:hypothetical protein